MRKAGKQESKKQTKRDIYARYGIEYDPKTGKIDAPLFGWVRPLLINGNGKLGRAVWTFSMLPGNVWYHIDMGGGDFWDICGTCPYNCPGCYAQTGRYNCSNVKAANARKTALVRLALDFVRRALLAQIEADNIRICRIHAAGDFDGPAYVDMWRSVIKATPTTIYWTYTKVEYAEKAFDDLENINVVKSLIPGHGLNYGPAGYIMAVYRALVEKGVAVYICRCGVDKNQHCTNCRGCYENAVVLFLEHSTDYEPQKDPDYPAFVALVESQARPVAA